MKYLTVIFAIYLLGLTLVPCTDAISETEADLEHIIAVDDDHHEDTLDLCTPFCHCQCCQVHIVMYNTTIFNVLNSDISTKISIYKENIGIDYKDPLFQPPRA